MLEPSPITNRSLGIGATSASARNAANAAAPATPRHRGDFTPAATSRNPPNVHEMTDCTAPYCASDARRRRRHEFSYYLRTNMRSKSKKLRPSKVVPEVPASRPTPNLALLALSCLGIALTAYLSWVALSGGSVRGCPAGGGGELGLTSRG